MGTAVIRARDDSDVDLRSMFCKSAIVVACVTVTAEIAMETQEENVRTSDRMNPTRDKATVHGLIAEPVLAAVIDESFGGLGIAVPVKLQPGQGVDVELMIDYGGVSCVALVRHVAILPSGARLGLEWKAQALSRCLRELLKVDTQINQELGRILPGGLSMMWKLFEAERWEFLLDNADRLRREVSSCGVHDLTQKIQEFQAVVQNEIDNPSAGDKSEVEKALNSLISQCIKVVR